MAPHVNLSGLVYFAASCYSSSEVTPHRGIRTLPFTSIPSSPYLLTFICRRTHPQPVESCHVGAKNECPHHCTNSLSLIKLSCFSYFADGYFHSQPHLVMKFVVSQEECNTHTHTNTHLHTHTSLSFLVCETNGTQV